ncbi:MAG: hypothetical protein ACREV6_22125 [Clostridium sp.]|uniref:hypothetical protein n=1 Tax=Clostridium sp. TaxID=1506 RepID=UPI003D6D2B1C
MELTVGLLENELRQFSKGTAVHVSCGCCNHGALGNETILGIADKTNQTYGYIELNLNNSSKAEVELSTDKEEFYKVEVAKLNKIIKEQDRKLKRCKDFVESSLSDNERMLKQIKGECKIYG